MHRSKTVESTADRGLAGPSPAGTPGLPAARRGRSRRALAARTIRAAGVTAALVAPWAPAAFAEPLEGCWAGRADAESGATQFVLELPEAAVEEGASGALHVLGGAIETLAVGTSDVEEGGRFRIVAGIGADAVIFEGTRDGGASARLTGTLTTADGESPLTLGRVPAGSGSIAREHSGFWIGTLRIGGMQLELVLELAAGPCEVLFGRAHSPDQGARDLPLSDLSVESGTLRFSLANLGASFAGELSPDGLRAAGTFTQGGISVPLTLEKNDEEPDRSRPQDPRAPFPYDVVDVTFPNAGAGIELAGTLTVPRGEGPFPAAILVSGSGPQNRDEALMGHRPFLVLSDHLTRNGIAVLRYDDRGVGASSGDHAAATSEDFAADAAAALAHLAARSEIDSGRVGIVGHSEGGIIAARVAAGRDDVAFVVLWAAPGVSGREVLARQTELLMNATGAGRPLIEAQLAYADRFYRIVDEEPDDDEAVRRIVEASEESLPGLTEEQRTAWHFARATVSSEQIEAQARQLVSPWFRYFLRHDPRDDLSRVTAPLLGVWGSLDLQVEPEQNLPAVAAALARADNDHHRLVTLPGLNHLLQPAVTGLVTEYGTTETTIAPEALDVISAFIEDVAGLE